MNAEPTPPNVPQPKTNKLAVSSLVLGIMAMVLCVVGVVFAIPGLICGIMGMKRVKNSGGAEKGHGFALAGTVLSGAALIMFPVIALLAAIAIPNFVKARTAAASNGCISNLRMIDGAKATWALENRKQNGEIPSNSDLYGMGKYIPEERACPARGTYSINPVGTKPTCSVPSHRF